MNNIEKFYEICSRSLADITDTEIGKFVELTGRYGMPEYWGEVGIDRIDRDMYGDTVVAEYSQTRVSGGVPDTCRRTLFLNTHALTYFTSVEPFNRMEDSCSICENGKMFLWLLGQGFNLFENMTAGYVKPGRCTERISEGLVVAKKTPNGVDVRGGDFFKHEDREDAEKLVDLLGPGHFLYTLIRTERLENGKEAGDAH